MLKPHVQAGVPLGLSGTSIRLLEDYKLEEILRSPHRFIRPEPEITQASQLLWRHRVQYAVSHAVNAFYSMDPDVRKEVPVQYMLEKWWPKKTTGFESVLHYWEVKNKIIDELSRIIRTNEDLQHPSILFEQWKTEIPSLSMELSMIFHAAWQPEGWDSLLIQKYMVVYDPNVIEAFQHMASVFCYEAFGKLPGMIEVYCLLEGRKIRFMPGRNSLARSMDYIHLIRDSVPQAEDVESDQFQARDKARIHEEADRRRSEAESKKTWLM